MVPTGESLLCLRGQPGAEGGAVNGSGGCCPVPGAAWSRYRLRQLVFRRLLAVFVLNGMASAVPATLVLFLCNRLQSPAALGAAVSGQLFCLCGGLVLWLGGRCRWGWPAAGCWHWPSRWRCFACVLTLGRRLGLRLCWCACCRGAVGRTQAVRRLRSTVWWPIWASVAAARGFTWAAEFCHRSIWCWPGPAAAGWLITRSTSQQDLQAVQALSLAYGLLPACSSWGRCLLLYRFFIRQDSPLTALLLPRSAMLPASRASALLC